MRNSLFLRIFAGYVLLAVGLSTVVLLLSFRIIRIHYTHSLAAGLRNLDASLALEMAPLARDQSYARMDSIAKGLGARTGIRITVIDTAGTVVADSDDDPRLMGNHRTRPEVMTAIRGEVGQSTRLSKTLDQEMLYVAMPIEQNGVVLGVVRASCYVKDIGSLVGDLEKSIVGLAGIVVIVSLLGALVFSRSLTRPIRELGSAARRVASGDFDAKVLLGGAGEIKELADSFNHMIDRTRSLVTELSRRQEEMKNIIASIRDGLVVLDVGGTVILSNEAFRKITGESTVEGKSYWVVLRSPGFGELIRKVSQAGAGETNDLVIDDRTYVCSASPIGSLGETVALFHDITELKKVEQMKKDFVVNLSHEMRTPLTAIRGFLETVEEGADQETRHYLDIIKRNTDRLSMIVRDLLELSELEDAGGHLNLEEVDLGVMLDDVARLFEHRVREKKLTLEVEAQGGPRVVRADPFKLEQVFVNLVDNALKYTERGGINLSLRGDGKSATIEVRDTGGGIPKEHLPRVFERFYVVDKSRSRKVGGTGLGLAIAKHIVLLHNGKIDVESTPGEGTRFIVTLPVNPT